MSLRLFLSTLLIACSTLAFADNRQPPTSWSEEGLMEPAELPVRTFPAIDAAELRKIDAEVGKIGQPLRFAVPYATDVTIELDGQWETLHSGDRIWRMRFEIPGATDMNFGFSRFRLPGGATLHVYDTERSFFQGPWGASNNKPHGQFWTPVVPGDSAVIELFLPVGARDQPLLEVGQVAGGYRDLFGREGGPYTKSHGSCNIDVICPEGDGWRDQIRSTARYSFSGSFLCTGSLINDVPHSLAPHFLTAHHCVSTLADAQTIVAYWNYEAPVCGQQDGGSLDQNQSGASLLATREDVDVTLVVLDEDPDEAWNVHFSGWDRSNLQPGGAVAIHHPSGHVKSISFAESDLNTTASCIGGPGTPDTHWEVPFWDLGTTEPGSSGSGIWNPQNGRLIGSLSGGVASCTVIGPDCYGKFAVAWDGDSEASRLQDWLDPNGTNPDGIDGTDPDSFNIAPEATQISQCGFADLDIQIDVTQAGDFSDPVTLSTADLPSGITDSFSVNPVTPPGETVLTLGTLSAAGTGTFTFTIAGSGGGLDRFVDVGVTLSDDAPGMPVVSSPADGDRKSVV